MVFFDIDSRAQTGCGVDIQFARRATGTIVCARCRRLRRELHPQPVDVVLCEVPSSLPIYGSLFRFCVPVYRADLVARLQPYLTGFVIGKCLTPSGKLIKEYVTGYSKSYVIMRGDETVECFVCPQCNSASSTLVMVMPGRPAYLLRHQLSDAHVYQDWGGTLFISEELRPKIDWSPFWDIRFSAVEVRDTPLDGKRLPGDPDWDALKRARVS